MTNSSRCSIPGCSRPHIAKGLCRRHYNQRWRATHYTRLGRRQHYVGVPLNCPLTIAQFEVIRELARGRTTKEIALERGCAYSSIRNRVSEACKRLRVNGVTQAIIVCEKEGWIAVDLSAQDARRTPPLTDIQRNYLQAFTALILTSPTARDRLLEGLMNKSESEVTHPPLRLVE